MRMMLWRLVRLLAGLVTAVAACLLLVAALVFVALRTDSGQAYLQQQTEALVGRMLGADYHAELGHQGIELSRDGTLGLAWSDVRLRRTDSVKPLSTIGRLAIGIRILPLLEGRLEFDRLLISGGRVDVAALPGVDLPAPAPAPDGRAAPDKPVRAAAVLSQASQEAIAALERQLAAMTALHFDTVRFSDVRLSGFGTLVPGLPDLSIAAAELRQGAPGSLAITADLAFGRLRLPITGRADSDPRTGRVSTLQLATGTVELGTFIPPGPADDADRRGFATDATVAAEFAIAHAGGDAPRRVTLRVSATDGDIQMGRDRTHLDGATLLLAQTEGEDTLTLEPSSIAFAGVDLTLHGRFEPTYGGEDRGFSGFSFAVDADPIRSSVGAPDGAPRSATASLAGALDLSARRLALTRLALATDGGELAGDGELDYGDSAARTRLTLRGTKLAARDVKAFWPFFIAGRTRDTVLERIGAAGSVPEATIALGLSFERLMAILEPNHDPTADELQVDVAVTGLDIKTVGALPDLCGAAGHVRTAGENTLISLEGATVVGLPDTSVLPSTMRFEKLRSDEVTSELSLDVKGPAAALLEIAGREPIDALRKLDVAPADASGSARAHVTARLRLGDAVAESDQLDGWSAAIDLDDVSLKRPVQGRQLSDVDGHVDVAPDKATGKLDATVDGLRAAISFERPIASAGSAAPPATIDLSVDGKALAKAVPMLAGVVDGPLRATVTEKGGERYAAAIDLSDTQLTLPGIGWSKGAGVPASLDLTLGEDGSATRLEDVNLSGSGFAASGSLVLDPDGLRSADFDELALNPGDDVALSLKRVSNGYSAVIQGKSLDARPFLKELTGDLGGGGGSPKSAKRQFDLNLAIDRVLGFDRRELHAVTLNYAGSNIGIAALSVAGQTEGAREPSTLDYAPRGKAQTITLNTLDAGALLAFAGVYARMEGGTASLKLQGASGRYDGGITLKNFTLVDEPRLSSLVSSAPSPGDSSLSQAVGHDLQQARAFFDHAAAGLHYGKDRLEVSDGILRGPVFGSSFEGTVYDEKNRIDIAGSFMPAYGVNRLFGALPLFGKILGNGNEGGLIGITYRLSGDFASPTLRVNPISVIAPGIFRRIFEY